MSDVNDDDSIAAAAADGDDDAAVVAAAAAFVDVEVVHRGIVDAAPPAEVDGSHPHGSNRSIQPHRIG